MDGEILKMKFNKMFGMLLVATTALGTVACHKHSYTVGAGGNTEGEAAYKKWESHWFFGMIGESQVKVSEVCPSGNATIKDSRSFLNGLVSAFTGIVWSPSMVTIYCDGGGAGAKGDENAQNEVKVQLSAHEMERIARDPRTMAWAERVDPESARRLGRALERESAAETQFAGVEATQMF